tara:strand:- start:60 stop:233 length:174 start_codon:yes stop_codon:yes gene_type:complete
MTRREFENYIKNLEINSEEEDKYWILYDKIYEPNSPLSFNQKANFLLAELRKKKLDL